MVTSATPASIMLKMFSGALRGLSEGVAVPFIAGFHAAFMFMVGASLAGAVFSALWGSEERGEPST
jgi:hypothetical protein